jgi:hypothetical protein
MLRTEKRNTKRIINKQQKLMQLLIHEFSKEIHKFSHHFKNTPCIPYALNQKRKELNEKWISFCTRTNQNLTENIVDPYSFHKYSYVMLISYVIKNYYGFEPDYDSIQESYLHRISIEEFISAEA